MPGSMYEKHSSRNLMGPQVKQQNRHVIYKRLESMSNVDTNVKHLLFKDEGNLKRNDLRFKRNNELALQLNCEILIVTDLSVYEEHKRFSQSSDRNQVFLHMKVSNFNEYIRFCYLNFLLTLI